MRRSGVLRPAFLATAGTAVVLFALVLLATRTPVQPVAWFLLIAAAAALAGAAYLVWHVDPAWTLSAAIAATMFSGNWEQFGLPERLAPDRLLLAAGVATLLLRAPGARDRPPLRLRPVHAVLALAAAFAVGSALAVDTFTKQQALFRLIDRFSIMAFLLFAVAPLAFHAARQRAILLVTLVGMGAYLGLTALFEGMGADPLVFPGYILDPKVGNHFGRARGPFVEAAVNGLGLYVCATAAAIGLAKWRSTWPRLGAIFVIALCAAGQLFTLQRAAWVATVVAVLVCLLGFRELRRYTVPAVATGVVAMVALLVLVPGLYARTGERASSERSAWDRRAQFDSALNMAAERPLVGFGWNRYADYGPSYVSLSDDYPLILNKQRGDIVHNVILSNLAELGLVGTGLWILGLGLAVGGAVTTRGPPELRPWRIGLAGIAVYWLVLVIFTPLVSVFPNMILWLWAGVVTAGVGAVDGAALQSENGSRHRPRPGPGTRRPKRSALVG